jgi:hypothetical protein
MFAIPMPKATSILYLMGSLAHYLDVMAVVQSHRAARGEFERDAIRLLCSELVEGGTRARLADLLKNYVFVDDLNHAVYESILSVGAVNARRLRELLPGRVTNLGFPDFELKDYLGRNGQTDDIDKLFDHLLELTDEYPQNNRKAMGQSA